MDAAITKAVKLPAIASGDANKSLKVKADETGHEHVDEYSDAEIDALIAATYTDAEVDTLLNAKAPIANPTFTGEIGIGSINVSETELGTLEGITPSTAELNYVNGVTSAIQTQFSGKLDKFPTGTAMVFYQSAAPTGWTKKTNWAANTAMVVGNTYSTGGGSDSPTSWTTNVQVADHANHSHESANHTHTSAAHTHTQANHNHSYTTTPYHKHTIGGYFTGNELGTDFNTLREGSSTNTSYVGSSTCYTAYYQGVTASRTPDPTGGPSERTTGNVSASGARTHVETQDTYTPRYQHVIAATKDA
jgi:hypothetical protein